MKGTYRAGIMFLLFILVTLSGCNSGEVRDDENMSNMNVTSSTGDPAHAEHMAGTGNMSGMDHSEHMQNMAGMDPKQQMEHKRHMEHMGGMGNMSHEEHMKHMAGMDSMNHEGNMQNKPGMGRMDHEEHMKHMAGMGNMSHEEHMKHMAGMGGMNHSEHMQNMPGMGGMDHSQHTQGAMDVTTELGMPKLSVQGAYKVSVSSELDPIAINHIHSWTLHVETATGQAVDNARITVDGGMPTHSHGLPTAPEVTQSMGNGDYLVEGMMFQMPGHWQVNFDISAGDQSDSVIFNFVLE